VSKKIIDAFTEKLKEREDIHDEMSQRIIYMIASSGTKMYKELNLFLENLCGSGYEKLMESSENNNTNLSEEILRRVEDPLIPEGWFKKVKSGGTQPRDKAAMNLSMILTGTTMDELVLECTPIPSVLEKEEVKNTTSSISL